jgi:hypothetical protein
MIYFLEYFPKVNCRRVGLARTLNRLVNLTLRVPVQMG